MSVLRLGSRSCFLLMTSPRKFIIAFLSVIVFAVASVLLDADPLYKDVHAPKVYETATSTGGWQNIRFDPVTARYVRIHGTKRNMAYGYSILSFRVLPK